MSAPLLNEQDQIESNIIDGKSRRSFLWKSLATTALAVPGAIALASKAARAAKPKPVPAPPTLPNLYPAWNARNFSELRDDEITHVQIINALLNDPGNHIVPAGNRPLPNFRNLVQPNQIAFAETAAAIENTGVGVYLGILQAVRPTNQGGEYFETAGEIATIEGRHTGYLNTVLDQFVVPGREAIDNTIDQGTALERIAPFIQDLNGGPDIMTFNPTPTGGEDNDFIILDFLLVLEMLEMQFYKLNVAKFFPGF
jgi:hypothetical protein